MQKHHRIRRHSIFTCWLYLNADANIDADIDADYCANVHLSFNPILVPVLLKNSQYFIVLNCIESYWIEHWFKYIYELVSSLMTQTNKLAFNFVCLIYVIYRLTFVTRTMKYLYLHIKEIIFINVFHIKFEQLCMCDDLRCPFSFQAYHSQHGPKQKRQTNNNNKSSYSL